MKREERPGPYIRNAIPAHHLPEMGFIRRDFRGGRREGMTRKKNSFNHSGFVFRFGGLGKSGSVGSTVQGPLVFES